jgi:putative flippase GtrA
LTLFSASFYRFGAVGFVGFLVDAGMFTVLQAWWHAPHLARLGAFLVAVNATYFLNKRFTFPNPVQTRPIAYLAGQSLSLAVNMGVFSLVIWKPVWLPVQYYVGLIAGSVSAMFLNYELTRRFAFGHR